MDFNKILNKFNDLGIEAKPLVPDAPDAGKATEQTTASADNPQAHARMIEQQLRGKHIPGVSDVSSNDIAALAGVNKSTQRPQPANPNPNSMYTKPVSEPVVQPTQSYTSDIETRLDSIERKLESIFESMQKEGDLKMKRGSSAEILAHAMYDLVIQSQDNPKIIDKIQQIYKMATNTDVIYDKKGDTFTFRKNQQPEKKAESSLFKEYLDFVEKDV